MALDDISYDLAVSTARMSSAEHTRTSCWSLPGSDLLSSKFWRRPAAHRSTSAVSALCNNSSKSPPSNAFKLKNRRVPPQGARGVIVNPLAEIHSDLKGISVASSSRALKIAHGVA